jgi:hypothetical protein
MPRGLEQNEARRHKILGYVKEHPGTTKNDVIKYMDEKGSSIMTTHGLIADLISDKILTVKKDKPNSNTHHLFINDENSFNKIDKELSEIERCINLADDFMYDEKYKKENSRSYMKFFSKFWTLHLNYNHMMLQELLFRANKIIHSENYSKLLTKRIVELMIRLDRQNLDFPSSAELDEGLHTLTNFYSVYDVKKDFANTILVDSLKTKIENFKNSISKLEQMK